MVNELSLGVLTEVIGFNPEVMTSAWRKDGEANLALRGGRRLTINIILLLLFLLSPVSQAGSEMTKADPVTSAPLLRIGMRGESVRQLQDKLKKLGFYGGALDGYFWNGTERAVKAFQRSRSLYVDGVVGPSTYRALELALSSKGVSSRGKEHGIEIIPWTMANKILQGVFKVTDVETGLQFTMRRRGGHLHADCEPLMAEDTNRVKRAFGGRWSWERRAVIVHLGSRRLAASMNGMPHGNGEVKGNGINGHFCIHFLGSRTHGSRRVDPEHQRMIYLAAK
ncbi:MAG TPA: hypothetical protein GX509_09070 [Firmicutes bacterium]|nr:hypothetical protein [Bacillota bacterium]HHY98877.1 hypothetical protein [Bacillota bacterium]